MYSTQNTLRSSGSISCACSAQMTRPSMLRKFAKVFLPTPCRAGRMPVSIVLRAETSTEARAGSRIVSISSSARSSPITGSWPAREGTLGGPTVPFGYGCSDWAHRSVKKLADQMSNSLGISPNYRRLEISGWFNQVPGSRS